MEVRCWPVSEQASKRKRNKAHSKDQRECNALKSSNIWWIIRKPAWRTWRHCVRRARLLWVVCYQNWWRKGWSRRNRKACIPLHDVMRCLSLLLLACRCVHRHDGWLILSWSVCSSALLKQCSDGVLDLCFARNCDERSAALWVSSIRDRKHAGSCVWLLLY